MRSRRRAARKAIAPTISTANGASHSSSVCAVQARLEQHELAVARDEEVEHLAVAVAGVSRSRTSRRRSRASGASESSIDWFWQTMQRSSWRQRARARFQRGIGQDLVGLHGERRDADERQRQQR